MLARLKHMYEDVLTERTLEGQLLGWPEFLRHDFVPKWLLVGVHHLYP